MSAFQSLQSPHGKHVHVKVGFCWPAFCFGPFWALYHRLWSLFARLAIVWLSLVVVDEAVVQPSNSLPMLVVMLLAYVLFVVVCGKFGNAWRVSFLLGKGYVPTREQQPSGSALSPANEASKASSTLQG
jgi:hypothetical protein